MTVLGVDIGNTGAVALLDKSGKILEVHDMPTLNDGLKGGPSVNALLLAQIVARAAVSLAYVERVGPKPTDGAPQAFSLRHAGRFGRPRRAYDVSDTAAVKAVSGDCAWQGWGRGRGAPQQFAAGQARRRYSHSRIRTDARKHA